MNIFKTLLPLVLLLSLLVVACQPQPTAVNIPEANMELVTYAVTGMTWFSCDKQVEAALLKLPGVASVKADKATDSASVVYDKTVFKPASVTEIGRFSFAVASTDVSEEESEESVDATDEVSATSDTAAASEKKSEFDFGDFGGLATESSDADKNDKVDQMPSLDGPTLN